MRPSHEPKQKPAPANGPAPGEVAEDSGESRGSTLLTGFPTAFWRFRTDGLPLKGRAMYSAGFGVSSAEVRIFQRGQKALEFMRTTVAWNVSWQPVAGRHNNILFLRIDNKPIKHHISGMKEEPGSRAARMADKLEAHFNQCDQLARDLMATAGPGNKFNDMPLVVALMRVCAHHSATIARLARLEEELPKKSRNGGSIPK